MISTITPNYFFHANLSLYFIRAHDAIAIFYAPDRASTRLARILSHTLRQPRRLISATLQHTASIIFDVRVRVEDARCPRGHGPRRPRQCENAHAPLDDDAFSCDTLHLLERDTVPLAREEPKLDRLLARAFFRAMPDAAIPPVVSALSLPPSYRRSLPISANATFAD